MSGVQVGQKSYEMPPRYGFTITHFLTVADIERSARFYETVFGGDVLSLGGATAKARPATFRSRIRGSSSTWGRPDTRQTVGNGERSSRS